MRWAAAHRGHSRGRGRGAGGCRPAAPGPTWRGWPGRRGWGRRPRSLGGGGPSLGHVLVTETLRPSTGGRSDATGPTTGHRRLGAGTRTERQRSPAFYTFSPLLLLLLNNISTPTHSLPMSNTGNSKLELIFWARSRY